MHALHAWNVGAGVSTWFEYVRSKANISDLPSRDEFELLHRMGSSWVDMRLPGCDDWFAPAAAWLESARDGRGATRGCRKRRRARAA